MKKMLITGSSGQVGSYLRRKAEKKYDVIGIGRAAHPLVDVVLDLSDSDAFTRYLDHAAPDIIVHTAALTWVDYSEDHTEETDANNVHPVQTIKTYAKAVKQKPHVIFISSDYVYDGKKTDGLYTEQDAVHPLNYYGVSKVKGEEILREYPNHCILRTGVVFSWHPEGKNFFMQTYNKMKASEDMKVVDDQISNPTYAPYLVEAILRVAEKDIVGTFNATGLETLNRFDFALAIATAFDLDAVKIARAKTTDFPIKAERPMNNGTDSHALYVAIDWEFPKLSVAFDDIKTVYE